MDNQMMLEEKNLKVEALENLTKGFSSLALLSKNPLERFVREIQLVSAQVNLRNAKNEREGILFVMGGCQKHVVGDITRDEEGNAYSKCRLCDKELTLVGKTLGDVDEMDLRMVEKLLPEGMSLEELAMSTNLRSGLVKGSEDSSS